MAIGSHVHRQLLLLFCLGAMVRVSTLAPHVRSRGVRPSPRSIARRHVAAGDGGGGGALPPLAPHIEAMCKDVSRGAKLLDVREVGGEQASGSDQIAALGGAGRDASSPSVSSLAPLAASAAATTVASATSAAALSPISTALTPPPQAPLR